MSMSKKLSNVALLTHARNFSGSASFSPIWVLASMDPIRSEGSNCFFSSISTTRPRNFELHKFGEQFPPVEEARDDLCMRERAGERVVRARLFGYAAVIEHGVEIERAAAMLHRRLQALSYHVHVSERVGINGAICKRPFSMPGSLGCCFEKVAVKGDILPGQRALLQSLAPIQECMGKVCLRLFLGICDLFFCESIDRERLVHHVRSVPNAALLVEAVRGVGEIERAEAHYRVFGGLCARGFDVYNKHSL